MQEDLSHVENILYLAIYKIPDIFWANWVFLSDSRRVPKLLAFLCAYDLQNQMIDLLLLETLEHCLGTWVQPSHNNMAQNISIIARMSL